jgi:hypothetical protein
MLGRFALVPSAFCAIAKLTVNNPINRTDTSLIEG